MSPAPLGQNRAPPATTARSLAFGWTSGTVPRLPDPTLALARPPARLLLLAALLLPASACGPGAGSDSILVSGYVEAIDVRSGRTRSAPSVPPGSGPLYAAENGRWLFAVGLLAGFALLADYQAAFAGVPVAIYLLWHLGWKKRSEWVGIIYAGVGV